MIEDALYYPYIGFNNHNWLKAVSLFYNRIYRIVPSNVIPNDSQEVLPLLEDGTIGDGIDPTPYSKDASEEFLDNVEKKWDAAALTYSTEERGNLVRLHTDKTDEKVRNMFISMGYKKMENSMYIPTELASNYMLYLATVISQKNNLSSITENIAAWTATSYFNLDGSFEELTTPFDFVVGNENPFYLFSFIIHNLTLINIADIPAKDILKFRKKRKDEMNNLRYSISKIYNKLGKIEDHKIYMEQVKDTLEECKKAIEEYKKSADLLKVKGWFGIGVMGLPAPYALAKIFKIPDLSTSVLIGTGLAIGAIYSLRSMVQGLRDIRMRNPYSCLALMEGDFSKYTRQRGGGDINFHLFNCMEEYIND